MIEVSIKSSEKFYPQTSVEASIMIRENTTALVIPAEYLLAGDSVMMYTGGAFRKIRVKTGVRNKEWYEVVEGLSVGNVISKQK